MAEFTNAGTERLEGFAVYDESGSPSGPIIEGIIDGDDVVTLDYREDEPDADQ